MKHALILLDSVTDTAPMDKALADTIGDIYEGTLDTELSSADGLRMEKLKQYHMVICLLRNKRIEDGESVAAILEYVLSGGKLLTVHDGLKISARPELANLLGARYLGDSTPCLLDFAPEKDSFYWVEHMSPFSITEDLPMFELEPLLDSKVFLTMKYGSRTLPAAWCHSYGWGRVACIVPGRQSESFIPPLRRLYWMAGQWLLDRTED